MIMRLSITVLNIIWITQNNRYWKIHKHMKHPLLDDLQACSETSKLGWYEASTFGWLTSMLRFGLYNTSKFWWWISIIRIIQDRMIQNILFWKQNLPLFLICHKFWYYTFDISGHEFTYRSSGNFHVKNNSRKKNSRW